MQEPDPAVVRAAQRGDVGAFTELVRAYQQPLWRFLRHLVADAALAEDLTQETFVRAYRRLGSFRFRSSFRTWLFQIARNAGIDALRERDRRARLLDRAEVPDPVPDPSARVEIAEGVALLPAKLREALLLVEVTGFSYREAATALRVAEGTVKSRVHRARLRLSAWLQEAEDAGSSHAM